MATVGSLRVIMLDMTSATSTQEELLFDKSGSQGNGWLWHNSKIRFRFNSGSVNTRYAFKAYLSTLYFACTRT